MTKEKLFKQSGFAAFMVFILLIPLFAGPYQLHILIMVIINVILASSLRLVMNSGLISLGHGGMMLVGAYTSSLLVMKLGCSSWIALLMAGVAAALVALAIGFPFMRIKGMYFSLVTVFLAEVIRLTIEQWKGLTGGITGITNIPGPNSIVIPNLINIDFSSQINFYYLAIVLVVVVLLILYAIERSSINTIWLGIQQADFLSESVGINTNNFKVLAFCIGCFFAGIAGGFYSQFIGTITPSAFGFVYSIYILIYVIVGGVKKFSGPMLGAIILTLFSQSVTGLKQYQPLFFAAILIIVIFFLREGLVSLPQQLIRRFSHD
jgi:branched-chain amino acid transport system permease protein